MKVTTGCGKSGGAIMQRPASAAESDCPASRKRKARGEDEPKKRFKKNPTGGACRHFFRSKLLEGETTKFSALHEEYRALPAEKKAE